MQTSTSPMLCSLPASRNRTLRPVRVFTGAKRKNLEWGTHGRELSWDEKREPVDVATVQRLRTQGLSFEAISWRLGLSVGGTCSGRCTSQPELPAMLILSSVK
jgi:hypothetical protein